MKEFSLKRDGELNISPHFKVKEFRSKCGSDKVLIDTDFVVNVLQKIREHFGAPITITSGYRSPEHNVKIGGSKNSLHLEGRAFDIQVKDIKPIQIAQYCEQICKIDGIIVYKNWCHIDSRTKR
jgi:uncharacterized protein YcbK (DUF882 family)